MVEKCFKANKTYTLDEMVDAFACIGNSAKTGREANETVVKLNEVIGDQFGIDDLQASLFAARILDYQPKKGATAAQIHEDLVGELIDVVVDPQCREIVNDTTPTQIAGIDKLRQLNTGQHISTGVAILLGEKIVPQWKRNSVGFTETIVELPSWKRNAVGAHIQMVQVPNVKKMLTPEIMRRIIDDARAAGVISESDYLKYISDK